MAGEPCQVPSYICVLPICLTQPPTSSPLATQETIIWPHVVGEDTCMPAGEEQSAMSQSERVSVERRTGLGSADALT